MGLFSNFSKPAVSESDLVLQALDKSLAVIEFKTNGTILRANDNFLSAMGYQLDEIEGRHHNIFVEKDYASSVEYSDFWDKLKRGQFFSDEFKRVKKTGEEVWIQATYNPVKDESGEVIKVVKFASDITEQKLKAADAAGQLDAISKSQAVIEFNMEGVILTANDNFCNAMGYQLSEIQGQHHSMFADAEYAASQDYRSFWQNLNQGHYDAGEYKRLGKGGKEIWIQASYNPIMDLSGKPIKVVKYASDITAQKAAEAKAKDTANFATILTDCQANIMVANNDLEIIFVNNQVQDMLRNREAGIQKSLPNFKVDALIGTCVDDFHQNPAHQRGMLSKLAATYRTKLKLSGLTFNLIATPWLSQDGERLGTLVEWEDITDELAKQEDERDISASNMRIKQALDNVSTSAMVADADNNIIYINQAAEDMMVAAESDIKADLPNFDARKLVGSNVDVFHKNPAHQQAMLAKLTTTYKTQITVGGRSFDLIANPIVGEDGSRIGTVVEWQDITEELKRLAKEKISAESNARIKEALDNVSTSAMVADADNNIIYINQAAEDMMVAAESDLRADLPNFDARKLVGSNVDVFHKNPAHQQAMLAKLTTTYKTQITVGGRSFDLIANPIVGEDGSRIGTVVEWQDITEELKRLAKAKALADTNARVKQALDNVATCTMVADEQNVIIYMNESVHDMLKFAESDLRKDLPHFNADNVLGQSVDIFHKNPEHQRSMLERLTTTYKTEIVVGGRTFSLTANPIVNDEGKRLGTVVEWLDRTNEVAIEQEVESLIESASNGDLTQRVETENKEGFFKQLSGGLNQIVGIAEGVIGDTVQILDALAHGDLTKRITKDYQGLFDKLKRDANATSEKLTEVIGRIEDSANTVATGAEEIAQGNADLSQRTEEQASSLEETASSMEEMTSTVRQNADNARTANNLAQEAENKASAGGDIVSKAVSSMAEINNSSKKIADIIGVIDEIAFQTNLLALNAAVEAARAGEQGRGFAVVAGEVRNLAQRSAAAAKEIKDLIRDSVSKVEDGTSLVNQSGDMLNEIVESVGKVNNMIADISVASEEQSAGIEQVNKAVSQMDEMTQQNAALVEQASAAGESMSEQARAMKQLLSFFRLAEGMQQNALAQPSARPQASLPSRSSSAPSNNRRNMPVASDDEEWEEF